MLSKTFQKRIDELRRIGREHGFDLFFVTSEPNIRYFTGLPIFAIERLVAAVIPTRDIEPVLIVPKLEEDKASKHSHIKNIRSYADTENPGRLIGKVLEEMKIAKPVIGIEGTLPYRFYTMLREASQPLEIREATEIFARLRRIKSEDEIEIMKKAAEITIKGVEAGIRAIRAGVSELSIAFEIEREIRELGGESVPYCLVLSGENSALPHGSTSRRVIRRGDAVVIDVSATYNGYYADITRTVFVGRASEKQKEIYSIVLEAQENAINSVKPGVMASEIDTAARSVIERAGYGGYFTHRTGHGIGLEVHEEPYITQTSRVSLEPGMVFTVEPGIYIPGSFGVRIEDDVVVTTGGREILTKMPKDLIEVS